MQFTISARGKPAAVPIQQFISRHYGHVPREQIESFFGFVEQSRLYGGRIFDQSELSRYDVKSLYVMGIGLRLPLTNHFVSESTYAENAEFLEKYHREGNSAIVTNDDLARWIRRDFPRYRVEASVIKNLNSPRKVEQAFETYDTVILPMSSNNDESFLRSLDNKNHITLFANAGCALTCPSKICYVSVSRYNRGDEGAEFQCSQKLKERNLIGMHDFDLDYLQSLGFSRFKLLRPRKGNMTGF